MISVRTIWHVDNTPDPTTVSLALLGTLINLCHVISILQLSKKIFWVALGSNLNYICIVLPNNIMEMVLSNPLIEII